MDFDYDISDSIKESLERYVEHRIEPGGFLMACLSNNFTEAVSRADMHNILRLRGIMLYMCNEIPMNCWGSPEVVSGYLKGPQSEG